MSATRFRAQRGGRANRDSLRSVRAGAVWTALPLREQHLLLWLLAADIVTADLASILVYRQLRTAQRRLRRLVGLGLLRGFWSASAHRPRGRYAYALTKATRQDVERIAWPEGRPDRPPDLPASVPIHQLATLDLLAALLRHGDPLLAEGLIAWVPERACGQLFGGFVRPDALAIIRIRNQAIALFVERDLGSERGETLPEKIRRYRSVFAHDPGVPMNVGFVVESERRARTIHQLADAHRARSNLTFVTALGEPLIRDGLSGLWSDGHADRTTRDLPAITVAQPSQILTPGCLKDGDVLAALDDRGVRILPELAPYVRS